MIIPGPFGLLLALVGLIAIIVWIVEWVRGPHRNPTALEILAQRFASGEIDRTEYAEMRRLIEGRPEQRQDSA